MAPKVEPIMLWGFCWATQQQQQFNHAWACAFHTSWYTDEGHPMWDTLDDANKRREIRYGNNIYVLFRALLHCKEFYNQESLWSAIARGFNTHAIIARNTAEILTEARRAQRDRPAKDVSDTARAVDDWIEFLDRWRPPPVILSDPAVHKLADAFFKTQEKKLVNAARVPLNPLLRQPSYVSTSHLALKGPAEGASPSSRLPPSPSIKLENQREPADRPLLERYPKGQATAMNRPGFSRQKATHGQATHGRGKAPNAPNQPAMDECSALRARIASLLEELTEIKSKPSTTPPTAAPAAAPQSQLSEDVVGGLKKDVATVTNVVGTMMESLHDIVDSLNSLQDEVSGLATQQKELTTTVSQAGNLNIDDVLRPIQTLSDTVNLLRGEISDLKEQATVAIAIPPPTTSTTHPQTTANLEKLFHEQNARIDALTRHVASMQAQMASMPRQQQATGQPQTLRQAMAAAEQDLRRHVNAIQRFYHSLDGTRGAASRAVTERTADFLALLTEGVKVAQAGEN
ncbi:hypothetical protein C8A03DRAFT_15937 [Achaetomium macrosporum]|uniref:Uncharacterized protein n=1 Tax=Achaetomium macrosporum TaxID=79813 RepID=A0AAN7H6M0_9PEZI|nr:hypothetical protein C8A03DRAFT_15937 [Achaetomium macrosporum]